MPPATPLWLLALAALPSPGGAADDDKLLAPPPLEVDGLIGVPIDILRLTGTMIFDGTTRTATATAEMIFEMTGDGGMPLFDLRQEVQRAVLDGVEIDAGSLAAHEIGPLAGTMRILEQELAAGQEHRLLLEYELDTPMSPGAKAIGWGAEGLTWDTWFSDLSPGRYLELWMPANLIYDRFAFDLRLELRGLESDHELVTNAEVEELGRHHWQLRFPPTTTAFSPMVVIVPSADVERSTSTVKVGGRSILIDLCQRLDAKGDRKKVHAQVERDLKEFSKSTGEWPHADRFSIYVWRGGRSMEYDGATTTSLGALRHEFFHSWWGRGVKPASQNDGWFDEAWDVYAADGEGPSPSRVRKPSAPVTLCSDDPYNRVTAGASYGAGSAFFARVAAEIGDKKLRQLMAEFFVAHAHRPVTTATLEQHLVVGSGRKGDEVRQLFHRYVYGKDGDLAD
ncbi:MAG: hypothetical protein ISR76_09750 [Planctomycetes bacterium]|nr:hypothetical protein [Planctomycetota bacterium]